MILKLDKGEHIAIDLIPQTTLDRTNVAIENGRDVRICDGSHVVKVVLTKRHNKIIGLLVDDIYVWRPPA